VKVAAVQMHCVADDRDANVEKALRLIEEAAKDGARVLVLPELFTTGYYCFRERNPELFKQAEPIPGPTTRAVGEVAKEHGLYVVAPVFERAGPGLYYNTAPLIGPDGEVIGKYSKTHIPPRPEEKYYFKPGSRFPVFRTEAGNIGMVICYDREFPEPFRIVALNGAELVLVPTVIFPRPKAVVPESWDLVNRTRAFDNGVYAVFVNRAGEEDGMEYFGHSLIINPRGEVLAEAGFDECVITATIDLEGAEVWRRRRAYERERRPEIYSKIVEPI